MGKNYFFKIGSIILFLVLAAYSCYATEHSLHLLSPNLPQVLVWAITVAFFVVASYASKIVVDSLNTKIYVENRKWQLCGGIILMILFWLIVSLPTNTHTFFYNEQVCDVVLSDIATTENYLEQIEKRQNTLPEYDSVEQQVNIKLSELNAEFNGLGPSQRRGNGQYVMQRMREINNILGSNIPIDPRPNVYDVNILNTYNTRINKELKRLKRDNYQAPHSAVDEAERLLDDLYVIEDTVKVMSSTGKPDEDIIVQAEGVLQNSYSFIKNNEKFVTFNNNDKDVYCAAKITTKTHQLKNVIKVWQDFFGGEYRGKGFFYWIMISLLVDIGAFIFFDLAFKKENY